MLNSMSKYQKLNHSCTLNCGQLKIGEKNSKYFAEHKLRNFGQQKFQKNIYLKCKIDIIFITT